MITLDDYMDEALNERSVGTEETAAEIKKFDANMKIIHKFWARKKGKMNVKQIKKVNDALEKIAAYLT